MALGDSRRESGQQMERAQRQIGANMESQRRAIDAQMLASRRGVTVVEDMQRLESPTRTQRPLPTVAPVGGIPPSRGRAYYSDKPKLGGGGIASPFTEVPDSREYHESTVVIQSADGSAYIAVKVPSVITMTDAEGAAVVFNYAANVDG